jgi:hypothetical protein
LAQVILTQVGSWLGGSGIWGKVLAAAGSFIGARIDQAVFGPGTQNLTQEGPRLTEAKITSSTEGTPIARMWGRQRLDGQMIWATRFLETITTTTQSTGGGKGGGGGTNVTTRTYNYSVSFAVAFCEGPAASVGRIWADGMLLDQSKFTIRFYTGAEDQEPDSFIVAKEGAENVPAFRGVAYLVFENMALGDFGNRIPVITAEIFKPLVSSDPDMLENRVSAITLIPASGEFAYGTDVYVKTYRGATGAENAHNGRGQPDLLKSLDSLESGLPHVDSVAVVSAWFGDDLRAGDCTIRPKVETDEPKAVRPRDWRVSGITRTTAEVISSLDDEHSAYGGTPSDDTIFDTIQELAARGKAVVFYPFILMDVPSDNTLPDPYSNSAATTGQPAYPWRGRITCSPAAGFTGTVDQTGTAATQVSAFFGTCDAGDFAWNSTLRTVAYSGPNEWTFRRLVLHYAALCAAANAATPGAVDAFLIGSEMIGVSTIRSDADTYPAVAELIDLAAECRTLLGGGVKIGYAADWSEYHSHRPADGSGDVFFHLDPLWADTNIDFVGVDNYMPLADWRDGNTHLDADLGGPYSREYLQSNIEAGEYFDWYYADQNDRDAQVRTPITDGTYSKPWVYRNKDLKSWWLNDHYNRPAGVEDGSPTVWTPESKPIWFTEFGCAAVNKGANTPYRFVDPKSVESSLPYYSSGARDDLAQRRFIEALLGYWDVAAGHNPTSTEYAAPMIDTTRCFAWTWDARPYPEFPQFGNVWGDSENWRLGHWLTGRVGVAPLADLVREICALVELGDDDIDVLDLSASEALVIGFVVPSRSSPREMLATLMDVYLFDALESGGKVKFVRRGGDPVATIDAGDLTIDDDGAPQISITRGQDVELPVAVAVRFLNEDNAYQQAAVSARRLTGWSDSEAGIDAPLVLTESFARALAETKLYETWIARETAEIELPPSKLALEPGDVITLPKGGRNYEMRIGGVDAAASRKLQLLATDSTIYTAPELSGRPSSGDRITIYGPPEIRFMDLPMLADDVVPYQPYVAAFATPWPGAVDVYRQTGSTFALNVQIPAATIVGETLWDFYRGPTSRWDDGNTVALFAYNGELESVDLDTFFSAPGVNAIAIENQDGEWEIVQFVNATLTAPNTYVISKLLRGQLGTEGAMRNPVPLGARWAMLDRARLRQLDIAVTDRNTALTLRYGPATAFHDANSYIEVTETFHAAGLRPFSPCHVKCVPNSGDWDISWTRRTRLGGDDWETIEVPLVYPDVDRYDVEVLDDIGGDVVRTISNINGAAFTYTSAMMTADYGGPVFHIFLRIYQLSEQVGRGSPWGEDYVFPYM